MVHLPSCSLPPIVDTSLLVTYATLAHLPFDRIMNFFSRVILPALWRLKCTWCGQLGCCLPPSLLSFPCCERSLSCSVSWVCLRYWDRSCGRVRGLRFRICFLMFPLSETLYVKGAVVAKSGQVVLVLGLVSLGAWLADGCVRKTWVLICGRSPWQKSCPTVAFVHFPTHYPFLLQNLFFIIPWSWLFLFVDFVSSVTCICAIRGSYQISTSLWLCHTNLWKAGGESGALEGRLGLEVESGAWIWLQLPRT